MLDKLFVFDIETIPDCAAGRKLYNLQDLDDSAVSEAMMTLRRQSHGNDFLPHYLQQIVAISVVFHYQDQLKVWSLGEPDSSEKELIERFFAGLEKYVPTLVSWNGTGFDLPVIHYRALFNGVTAPQYWEAGEQDQSFRYNNYLNRYHNRHIDLMDVLSAYQGRASAPLNDIAALLGFPGKMGLSGSNVWKQYQEGNITAIRDYCETDVLNTYLVYLRFELMRGTIHSEQYQTQLERVATLLQTANKPHLTEFLHYWKSP